MADGDRSDMNPSSAAAFREFGEFKPLSSTVKVAFGAQSRCGTGHGANEDHYAIIELGRHQHTRFTSLPESAIPARFDEFGYGMVVADGIGVAGDGETASRIAIGSLMHLLLHFGHWNLRVDERVARDIMERGRRFYRDVDSQLLRHGLAGPLPGPQTTMTAVFGAGQDLFIAHVGHSRAYLSRDGVLVRLTHDHTVGPDRVDRVSVTPLVDVSTAARDLQHILTDTLGMSGPAGPSIDIFQMRIDDDDRVLLCTNGLTDAVDEPSIEDMLACDQTPEELCWTLIEAAAGAVDDVTVLTARYRVPG